jgi:hypothetical protein
MDKWSNGQRICGNPSAVVPEQERGAGAGTEQVQREGGERKGREIERGGEVEKERERGREGGREREWMRERERE